MSFWIGFIWQYLLKCACMHTRQGGLQKYNIRVTMNRTQKYSSYSKVWNSRCFKKQNTIYINWNLSLCPFCSLTAQSSAARLLLDIYNGLQRFGPDLCPVVTVLEIILPIIILILNLLCFQPQDVYFLWLMVHFFLCWVLHIYPLLNTNNFQPKPIFKAIVVNLSKTKLVRVEGWGKNL